MPAQGAALDFGDASDEDDEDEDFGSADGGSDDSAGGEDGEEDMEDDIDDEVGKDELANLAGNPMIDKKERRKK